MWTIKIQFFCYMWNWWLQTNTVILIFVSIYTEQTVWFHTQKYSATTDLLCAPVSSLFIYCNGDDKWIGTMDPFTFSSTLSVAVLWSILAGFSLDPKLLISRSQVNSEYTIWAKYKKYLMYRLMGFFFNIIH